MMPPMPRTGAYSDHAEQRDADHLYLLDVVCAARDQRSCGETVRLSAPEKETTFLNTLPLRPRLIAAAVREAM